MISSRQDLVWLYAALLRQQALHQEVWWDKVHQVLPHVCSKPVKECKDTHCRTVTVTKSFPAIIGVQSNTKTQEDCRDFDVF